MQKPFDLVGYGQQVRKTCVTLMADACKAAEISGRMHLLNCAAEKDLAAFGESPEASRVACGPGCGACCILNVSVLIPESITIAWFIQKHFTDEVRHKLIDRLRELSIKTSGVDDEDRIFMHEECAFLDGQGSCSIHDVRPLMCRAVTSTNPEACREGLAMAPLLGSPVIEMNMFHKNMIDTVYSELANALEELGLDHRPRRLSSSVLALLTEPELISLYAAGERLPVN